MPTSMKAGSSYVVEYQIEKGSHAGFGKLQLDIPFGFTAKVVETNGASFTFSGQVAKFIWMTLPTETSFKVKMELAAASNASGNHAFKGQFSYIEDNQRKDFDLPVKSIAIEGGPETLATANSNNGNATGSQTSAMSPESTLPIQGVVNDNCYREVVNLGGGKYLVKVTVKDLGVKGYAKLEEKITGMMSINSKKALGAVVITDQDFIKFVWFDAPQTPEFTIEYEVSAPVAPVAFNGKFSYVKANAPTEMEVGTTASFMEMMAAVNKPIETPVAKTGNGNSEAEKAKSDSIALAEKQQAEAKKQEELMAENKKQQEAADKAKKEEAIAEAKKQEAANAAEAKKQQELSEKAKKEEAVVEAKKLEEAQKAEALAEAKKKEEAKKASAKDTAEAKKENDLKNISKAPAPEVGVTYKVQILAAHRTVGKEYFVSRHNFSDSFNIENHEGWVKYTTGKFGVYADARNAREEIRSKYDFDGPFVTAYNQGERITVQEALIISNQQWIK